jgi:hypothetical protein
MQLPAQFDIGLRRLLVLIAQRLHASVPALELHHARAMASERQGGWLRGRGLR